MSEIQIKKIVDKDFGNLVYLTNGIIEIKASLDFGPRILHYSLLGMDNMFYVDTQKRDINDISYKQFDGKIFKLYGGHRLWAAPEVMPRCYYPDEYPLKLTETSQGVILEAPIETFTNLKKNVEIRINDYSSDVEIIHSLENLGAWDAVYAPWAITMMDKNGVLVIPQTDRKTGFLGNRFVALWPYAKMNDSRVTWGDKYITLKQDPNNKDAFKMGTNNEKGWAAYFNKNQLFFKSFNHVVDGFYPDFLGCSFEAFTNSDMLEIESLGLIGGVKAEACKTHSEKWSLFKENFIGFDNEEKITEVIDKYI